MRRTSKAATAGSTQGSADSRNRRAFASRGGSLCAEGTGAPSLRLALASLAALCIFAAFTATSALAAPPTEFGSEGTGAGQFENPVGIAVDQASGDVYIADKFNNRVDKFGPEGEFKLAFGWGVATGAAEPQTCGPESSPPSAKCRPGLLGSAAGQLNEPHGIAIDNDPASPSVGDLYVADANNNRIAKFSPSGEFLLAFGGEVKVGGGDVCLAGEQCQAGSEGTNPGEFDRFGNNPIAVDSTGTVYVADYDFASERVQKFSGNGALVGTVNLAGTTVVLGIAVDSASDIYVNGEQFNGEEFHGVRKYDATGTELGVPRDESAPTAIAVGPEDELFVGDGNGGAGRILTYDPAGTLVGSFDAGTKRAYGRGIAYSESTDAIYALGATAVRIVPVSTPGTPLIFPGSEASTEVLPTTATLGAALNPEGGEETTYHFEYDTAPYTEGGPAHGESTPAELLPVNNEVQTLTLAATAGGFTLAFKGEASAEIPFDATAAEVQAKLEAIPTLGSGNVAVTGSVGGPFSIEFIGALAAIDVVELSPDSTNLINGGEPGTATILTASQGHSAFEDREVSVPITALQPRTTYHFRIVVTNKAGKTATGPDQSFETLPPVSIDATSVSGVADTSATLEAELNPHGLPTTYHFEYDTTPYAEGGPSHGTSTPTGSAGSGTTDVTRTAPIGGLAPLTTYHYRVIAANSLGTVTSPDRSFTTQGAFASLLPDNRAPEQVSPPDKQGIPLDSISNEGGLIQAAADGSAITYFAHGPIVTDPAGNRSAQNSQILSARGAAWSTADITPPHEAPTDINPFSEYKLFSSDLSLGALQQGPLDGTPLSPETTEKTPYLRQPSGAYAPLVTEANVPAGVEFGGAGKSEGFQVNFLTATPDFSHVLVESVQPLTEDFSPGFPDNYSALPSIYEWSAGALRLVSRVPPGSATSCDSGSPACVPAAEAGQRSEVGNRNLQVRNAISTNGSRVVFESGPKLYLRDLSSEETIQLDASQGGFGNSGSGVFQFASADGSRIFFTDGNRLTEDSTAGASRSDLYMCQVEESPGPLACELSDLTANTLHPAEPSGVLGAVIGGAEDGSSVYFVAQGALVPSAVHGDCAGSTPADASGQCNLYRYDTVTATTSLIAVLSGADLPDWSGATASELQNLTARVSPKGRYLAFMSQRPLTGYDNRDAKSGARDQEVFLYDSAAAPGEALACASCNPSGTRPSGVFDKGGFPGLLVDRHTDWDDQWLAANIPGWTGVGNGYAFYQSRYLSDSGRLFFNAADALVPQDSNGVEDVYEFELPKGPDQPESNNCTTTSPTYSTKSGGCVSLISAGVSPEESAFMDASKTGDDVFFLTASKLAPTDVDGALDLYDARVDGNSASPAKPVECAGDACQHPAPAPNDPTPSSLTFNGAGNLAQCPKAKVKRSGKCVKQKAKKRHHRKGHKKQKRANANRGGQK